MAIQGQVQVHTRQYCWFMTNSKASRCREMRVLLSCEASIPREACSGQHNRWPSVLVPARGLQRSTQRIATTARPQTSDPEIRDLSR